MHRRLRAVAAISLGLLAGLAQAALPAIDSFFGNPNFSAAKLSPNGRYLAVRISNNNERDGLAVVDLASSAVSGVARFSDVDIGHFQWVNNRRLAFDTVDNQVAPGDRRYAPGLYAANRDGSDLRQLAERAWYARDTSQTNIKSRILPANTYMLEQEGAQDSDSIYVMRANWNEVRNETRSFDLQKLNTVTGAVGTLNRPGEVQHWVLDQRGLPRAALTQEEGKLTVQYLDPDKDSWRPLVTFPAYANAPGNFMPLGFGAEGQMYVSSQGRSDKRSLYVFNLAKGALEKDAMVGLADYDFSGELVYRNNRLAGVELLSDARAMVWLDPAMAAVQKAVDALLPDTANLVTPPLRPEAAWVLVTSYSDKQPTAYLVYNTETKALSKIGSRNPAIDPAQMAQLDLHRFKARDGLTVPAWLTLPKGGGKQLPMVVLVHGGPFVRGGEWRWNAEAQFLASRGYAVLEPEFRGSTGFGARHAMSGWKQWGLAMQDDVADATKWAIAQGYADPKRICIAGSSYGGYATLMGLLKTPDLYRCGVSWAGVSDLTLMATEGNSAISDQSDTYRQYGIPERVGDPVKDAAQFAATSPLKQASRIRQPILLAHGSADKRVPIQHSKDFYNAVKPTNPDVELVIYDDEGHGWSLPKNRVDFWGRVEVFLNRHIGPTAK
jgi:dipeptidyl aminopeptidase/acylaminoacyl peptidase